MKSKKELNVLLVEPIHQDAVDLLSTVANVFYATGSSEEQLVVQGSRMHAIIIRAHGRVTAKVMDSAPGLVVVARHGTGSDNIDAIAAAERGIYVVNTPGANTQSVAEHCVGMMLAVSKRLLEADRVTRQGQWDKRLELVGVELYSKCLGLIGFGNIGQRVASICHRAFDMRILYYDVADYTEVSREMNAQRLPLNDLLRQADYVSVHVPLLPQTVKLIGRREFALMKESAVLLNLARGPVVDEVALIEALERGTIAGAGLDVFGVEPTPVENPLLKFANVVATPHVAALTQEALRRMAMMVAADVMRVWEGLDPQNWVNRSLMRKYQASDKSEQL